MSNGLLKVSQTIPLAATEDESASSTRPNTDAELVRRLRDALRDVGSALLASGDASECTVDIPESEVVYLVLSAASRRVEWLESQLSAVSTVTTTMGADPSAVLRKATVLYGDLNDDDGGDKRPPRAPPVAQRTTSSSSSLAPAPAGRVRGATVSGGPAPAAAVAAAPPVAGGATTKIEISGNGLASAAVGRVASFAVRFVGADGKVKHVSGKTPSALFRAPGGAEVSANVTKCRDGSFALSYLVPAASSPDAAGSLDVFINGLRTKLSPYAVQLTRSARP